MLKRLLIVFGLKQINIILLISSLMVLLAGLVASARETNDPVFAFALGLLFIGFMCGSGLLICWKIVYHWYLAGVDAKNLVQNKLKKSFGSLNNMTRDLWDL